MSRDVPYLRRIYGPKKLTRALERLKLCTFKKTNAMRAYVFDRQSVLDTVQAALGDETVTDCTQAQPCYLAPASAEYRVSSNYRTLLHGLDWDDAAIDEMDSMRVEDILVRKEKAA
jgi:hypothetical protein